MSNNGINKRKRGRPRLHVSEKPNNIVIALDRGLKVLHALSSDGNSILSDIANKAGLPASSAHRILATLEKHGFVELNETTQEWAIGIEAFRVGSSYLDNTNLVKTSYTIMSELMEKTGETANLGIIKDGDVVFISQVESKNPIRAFFGQGTRSPIHASGIGKAILAYANDLEIAKYFQNYSLFKFTPKTIISLEALIEDLEITKTRGWAFDDEERYYGMRCVAAPIFDSNNNVISGISISGPTARFTDSIISELGPQVNEAAYQISHMLGAKPNYI